MKPLFELKGFWNGEPKALFTACIIKPKKDERRPLVWWNAFTDIDRQAIEITYEGEKWCIDNAHGTGFYKVTKGMGSPSCGHASFGDYEFIRYIPQSEMIIQIDFEGIVIHECTVNEYQQQTDPIEYEKLQSLKKHMESFQKMSPAEKIKDINSRMVKTAPPSKQFQSKHKKDGKGKR